MFPKVEISDFKLRLTKKQEEMYEQVCRNYARYKDFASLYKDKEVMFNYGIYFKKLDSEFDEEIVFCVKDKKDEKEYIVYDDRKSSVKNVDFLSEMFSYLIHFGKTVDQEEQYNMMVSILYDPCVIPYETYLSLDREKIKNLIDNVDLANSVYMRNVMEEYMSLILPYEDVVKIVKTDADDFINFMSYFTDFIEDLNLIFRNVTLSMLDIGVEDDVLYIKCHVEGKRMEVFYRGKMSYLYLVNGERDEEGERMVEMIWKKIFRLYFQ
jgi:hypothetical protein